MKKYKGEEPIKETYTDEELKILLQKPNMKKCTFAEYRTWVVVNFLINSGSRGVRKTSTHLLRHTFAKKYLVYCGGNALMLQKLLGHSTLDMTKHYSAIR